MEKYHNPRATEGEPIFIAEKIHLFYFISTLWKQNLRHDGQQFHKYQQNAQLPLSSSHLTMSIGISVPGLGQHNTLVGYNQLMESQHNMQINVGSRCTDCSIIDNWLPLRYIHFGEF